MRGSAREFPDEDDFKNGYRDPFYRPSEPPPTPENKILDIKAVQLDRARTSQGYPFKTFDEMSCESKQRSVG